MSANRLWRPLSTFNYGSRRWVPVSSRNPQSRVTPSSRLSLVSWNIDAFSPRLVARANLILKHILDAPKSPDIIFLQEVTLGARASLLDNPRVRASFLATDAEDATAFENVPFATMALLSRARFAFGLDPHDEDGVIKPSGDIGKLTLGRVYRVTLPSMYGRDALYVDIVRPTAPESVARLINVHLDSLWQAVRYRAQQMEILADVLREPRCAGGIIAGDFNAINPEDDGLIEKNNLVDAWVALHGRADPSGATWGTGAISELQHGQASGRLDKIAMMGLAAQEMEVLRPGKIEVPRPNEASIAIPWSDHCGLRCSFSI